MTAARREPRLSKRNMAAQGQCPLVRQDQSGDIWTSCTALCLAKSHTEYQHKDLIPTFKHVDGGVMVWACFVAAGAGHQLLSWLELKYMRKCRVKCEANCGTAKVGQNCKRPRQSPDLNRIEIICQDFRELCKSKCSQIALFCSVKPSTSFLLEASSKHWHLHFYAYALFNSNF